MDSSCLNFGSSSSPRCAPMHFLSGPSFPIFQGARSTFSTEETTRKRLLFFTPSEELTKAEYYDELLPEKKRRLTPDQVQILESSFEAENKLEQDRKNELAKKLGLKSKQVAVWFQNRRARWRTKQLELNLNRLNQAYSSLVADHYSLLKDNARLRSQVAALTEILQSKESVVRSTTEETDSLNINIQAKAEDHQSADFQESFVDCIVWSADGGGIHSKDDDGRDYIPADNWWGNVWN